MRQVVLLGSPGTRRTVYLEQAAAEEGLPVLFIDWKDWERGAAKLPEGELFLKIDPPVWESCRLTELDGLAGNYRRELEKLAELSRQRSIMFLNHPDAILALLDKRVCKERLRKAGLLVTEELSGQEPQAGCQTAEELLELMRERRMFQVFVKPVYGSGAAGVSAFRVQPATGRMALYTCAKEHPEYGLVNTKRLRCFTGREEIFPLLNGILGLGCIVERWYVKAEHQGCSYDLRMVMQEGVPDFLLARLSGGPVTNLHLNNHPLEFSGLGLPAQAGEEAAALCRRAMECFPGLMCAGIDLLLERGSLRPRIIEMNAQGDLMYQDIFHENRIYRHQAAMMLSCSRQAPEAGAAGGDRETCSGGTRRTPGTGAAGGDRETCSGGTRRTPGANAAGGDREING